MYAGITVFCLTLTWGICVIFGSKSFTTENSPSQDSEAPTSRPMLIRKKLSFLTKSGVTTDKETSITAGIMLLSLIPFIILQLSAIISTSSGDRKMILIALVVSVSGLLAYFAYQIFFPWIQERSLEYTKYENLRTGFLQHMERHATGKLVTNKGTPNISVIKSFFAKIDKDGDQSVSFSELEALILEMKSAKVQLDKEYAVAEVLKSFDVNQDGTITKDEFIAGCKKWIHEHETKKSGEHGSSHSRKYLHQVVVQDWFEKRRHELAKSEHLMSRILKHVQNHALETQGLLTDEGRPNIDGIKSLFENIDKNNNKYISESELKELIQNIKFGKAQPDPAMVVESVMKDFDKDGDHMISEQEFVKGITKWLHNDTRLANSKDVKMLTNKFDQIPWKEVDSLVHKGKGDGSIIHKLLSWDCVKSVLQIILGIAIVSFLADPLIYSILDLSVALGLPTFYISFVIIPFALKFKLAMSAIFPASQKSLTTSSLTFSEIYGGVVMNNITGLSILLAIVYIKGLTWDYSIEVLVVLVVCAIIGLIAFFCSSYPLWTCILAFFLYPFSLVLVHFLPHIFGLD
ncbi:Calmodulin-like protein [Actinidia chinensis var. chinensis]|uniref:Calmodulin-like protein n=1 Tax=Actinidia chinensis var. chinensis TaxID=1590841 RepID=A0A2R6RAL6_ACTCC|nr:Calmodulin-like protein [Actinidia chinensis var. chinensis]